MIRDVTSNELFTVLLVAGLFIVALSKLLAPKRFDEFLYVIGNSKYLKIYSRDQKFLDRFDALLFVNLTLSGSVFICVIYQFLTEAKSVSVNMVFKLIVGIGVFILIKVLVERLLGSLFEIDTLIDDYLFQKITIA